MLNIYFLLFLVLVSCNVFAANFFNWVGSSNSVCDSEKKGDKSKNKCMDKFCLEDQNKEDRFNLSFDLLYFKTVSDSMQFTFKESEGANIALINNNTKGRYIEPNWKYEPGFRMNFGVPTYVGNWEVDMGWTWIRNHASKSCKGSNYDFYNIQGSSIGSVNYATSYFSRTRSKWDMLLNVFEVVLKNPIQIQKSFKFCPIIGVEGAYINQKLNIKNQLPFSDTQPGALANIVPHIDNKNDTWGVGPKVGFEVTFVMPLEFHFNFLASFASLFGQGYAKSKYSVVNYGGDMATGGRTSSHQTRLFTQIQLQAALEKVWSFNKSSVALEAGWETQTWFRQLRLNPAPNIEIPSAGSDLTLQSSVWKDHFYFLAKMRCAFFNKNCSS